MTARNNSLVFPAEKDLEDYLVSHLSIPGKDLLVIGRQVKKVGVLIDLLAIDANGMIYIIELKKLQAGPSAIGQILAYRHGTKHLNREGLIRLVAEGVLELDLVESFQRHFGHPLPETVNEAQEVVIIGASNHPHATDSILELQEEGYPVTITEFRYVRTRDGVNIIPYRQSGQGEEEGSHSEKEPSTRPDRIKTVRQPSVSYPIDESFRRFWSVHAQDFGIFVTFGFIFEQYQGWVGAQPVNGMNLRNKGSVGRQVRAITAESDEWSRVWVAHREEMAAYSTFKVPSSVRPKYDQAHRVVAYQRNPVGREQEI